METYRESATGRGEVGRKPAWLKKPVPEAAALRKMESLLRAHGLHTVCESASCPNLGSCFERGTATFLIMGEVCTRDCGFCGVAGGTPEPLDPSEPGRVAGASVRLALSHVVVTSVTRDDLVDGGAAHFAATIKAIRSSRSRASVEVLTPDFRGRVESLDLVLAETPEVFNHNMETVERLYPIVRPQADYQRSLRMLRHAARLGGSVVKTGCMVGLGETQDEVRALLEEVAQTGTKVVTIGQYLQPAARNLPVMEYVDPAVFERYREWGETLGMQVHAGPFVRSSFQAFESFAKARKRVGKDSAAELQ